MKQNHRPTELKILVVDRHKIVRDVLCNILAKTTNARIFEAEDGLKALSRLENHVVDILITDIHLPLFDGIKLTEWVKSNNKHTKVIALSMLDDSLVIRGMIKAGIDAYVLKEGNLDDLFRAIEMVQQGESYFSPTLLNLLFERYAGEIPQFEQQFPGEELSMIRDLLTQMSLDD